jgi:REP element-mobilizing transposase RayT
MSELIDKSLLLYHLVCPIKYRRSVLPTYVEAILIKVCKDISDRYEKHLLEIEGDENHVHFLIQSIPILSAKIIVQTVKIITVKELFRLDT